MEAKKNPSKDLDRNRNQFLLIGFSVSITFIITAFEWRTVKEKPITRPIDHTEQEVLIVIPSTTIDPPSAPKPILKFEEMKTNNHDPGIYIVVQDQTLTEEPAYIDLSDPVSPTGQYFSDEPTEKDSLFIFVEKKPEPVVGFTNFYKILSASMKYPSPARRMGVEGNVFVEFVINKNGEPTDLKVIRGIGSGCDEEAMRVLALTKWEPGKQRGKPVRVKMVLPIRFRLSQ